MGVFRYNRLNFGINTAGEIFQRVIEDVISGLSGVINMSDDLLVHGSTEAEHDENLRKVLQQLSTNGLTLNTAKCVFKAKEVDFYGMHFGANGVSVQESKVDALVKAGSPKSVSELRSLLGLANYCSRFVENLASIL